MCLFSLSLHKIHGVQIVLSNFSWMWGLPLGMVILPFNKIDTPPSSYQISLVPQLRASLHANLSSSMLGLLSGLILQRSYVCCHNCCDFIYVTLLLCQQDIISLKSPTTSGSYDLFCLLFCEDL